MRALAPESRVLNVSSKLCKYSQGKSVSYIWRVPVNERLRKVLSISSERTASVRGKAAAVDGREASTGLNGSSGYRFGISCSQGPRETMEDELCCIPGFYEGPGLYAAIFDGHGGSEAAKWLNDNLQDFLGPALAQSGNYEAALQAAFQAADDEILSQFRAEPLQENCITGAGSTASVVIAKDNELITANIGDSSVVMKRKTSHILLTREHRVFGRSQNARAETNRVRDTGGWVSRDGRVCDVLAVSRAFGDAEFKGEGLVQLLADGVKARFWTQKFADSVHFTSNPVIPTPSVTVTIPSEDEGDEFIVMATDGLWDFWTVPGIMKCAHDSLLLGATEEQVADILVEKVLQRYSSDNVAVIVITFPWTQKLLMKKGDKKKKGRKGLFGF